MPATRRALPVSPAFTCRAPRPRTKAVIDAASGTDSDTAVPTPCPHGAHKRLNFDRRGPSPSNGITAGQRRVCWFRRRSERCSGGTFNPRVRGSSPRGPTRLTSTLPSWVFRSGPVPTRCPDKLSSRGKPWAAVAAFQGSSLRRRRRRKRSRTCRRDWRSLHDPAAAGDDHRWPDRRGFTSWHQDRRGATHRPPGSATAGENDAIDAEHTASAELGGHATGFPIPTTARGSQGG